MDIPELEAVVNYDVPHLPEEYIHRVGRTGISFFKLLDVSICSGRMSRLGTAITFVASKPIVTNLAGRYEHTLS
jgi:ATP-dependent RNA helicase RhlE